MMLTVEVNIGQKAFKDAVAAFNYVDEALIGMLNGASTELTQELKKALQLVANKMQQLHGNPWTPSGGSSATLHSRSGGGLRAIQRSIKVNGNGTLAGIAGRITTGPMAIHETGGTIRAKSAGYLTIPLPSALDQRGVPLKKRAREWQNTFVARSKRGNLLIFQKRGRNNIVPLYILKPEVTIKPRLGMEKAIVSDALPYFERKAFEAIVRHIEEVL
jgi:hypothetical protein